MAPVDSNERRSSRTNERDEDSEGDQERLSVIQTHGYTLGKTLGMGTYATVRLAKSDRHQEYVAVKIISKFQAPVDYLLKFLPREIEVVKGLRHPNLIKFLQAIETTHRVYVIMEYAENGTLLEIIKKESFIEEDPRSKKWFLQLKDAVEYCHDHGVVHRDIKCENLLMNKDFVLKLSDFGFARGHMKPRSGGSPILSETFCGSYAYASPEILKGIPYEPQLSDIWSMGVVLFAMLFGRLPYDDSNYNKLVKSVQSRVKFPRNPVVSDQAKLFIGKLLAPLRVRLRLPAIANESWLTQEKSPRVSSTEE